MDEMCVEAKTATSCVPETCAICGREVGENIWSLRGGGAVAPLHDKCGSNVVELLRRFEGGEVQVVCGTGIEQTWSKRARWS